MDLALCHRWLCRLNGPTTCHLRRKYQFGLNAPANNYWCFYVDVQALPSVDPAGMHVAGDFQGNNLHNLYVFVRRIIV
ncbi:MAG: hypothetical protein U0X76_06930 [Bacteroidia bacterium]